MTKDELIKLKNTIADTINTKGLSPSIRCAVLEYAHTKLDVTGTLKHCLAVCIKEIDKKSKIGIPEVGNIQAHICSAIAGDEDSCYNLKCGECIFDGSNAKVFDEVFGININYKHKDVYKYKYTD